MGGRSRFRRPALAIVATILALTGALGPLGTPTAAAVEDGLALTTSATYTIVPERRLVRVALDLTARNLKPNVTSGGITTRYFYESARLAVQPEARNVRATSGGARVPASLKPADGYAILEVRFRNAIFFRQAAAIRVTFDLPGGAPRSASDIRVGTAFATFVAWAFGDTGAVRVVVPAGFEADATGSPVSRSTSGGATVFRATAIADPADWYVIVNADRKGALTRTPVNLAGGERIVIHAWPEDAEWQTRVSELLTSGLPELVEQTGLDWPVQDELGVYEVHTPLLEGYAGVFFQDEDRIEISEDLDDLTILHEASHAWFNGELFRGRWINEGLADTYAAKALEGIGIGGWEPKRVNATDADAVRLIAWEHPGRISDEETDAREQFGYNAAWTVVRSLVVEVGESRMRAVLAAAEGHQIPYVGVGDPEAVSGPADWRRFLDLLEEVGRSKTAEDLFRRWVVTDAETAVLDSRKAARAAYADLVRIGADWRVPFFVRSPMSTWDFAVAAQRTAEARAVIARRDDIAALTGPLGVQAPASLRDAYQAARDSLDEAATIGDRTLAAARALTAADAAVRAPRDPIASLGLLGVAPEADLATARAAFGAGDADAEARATALAALIAGAGEVGGGRLTAIVVGLVVVLVLLAVAAVVIRRRRRGRAVAAAAMAAAAVAPAGPVASAAVADPAGGPPYATLGDQSGGRLDDPPGPESPPTVTPTDDPDPGGDRSASRPTDTGDAS
ncbi:MAG TPA: hypothetical protein VFK35_10285 [Candidatus Limnocylindrales bacterium]|nr:hypothetical protein [Candidatus Limnocylindrales bacterium]